MAIRFTSEFRSDTGIDYKIEIDDSVFVGSPTTFVVGSEGFTLEYAGETDDIISPIMSSNVSIPFMVQNVLQQTFFEQLVAVQESRFRIKISRWVSGAYQTYWVGYIMQDIAQIEDAPLPYIYDLRAVDGLGRLANIDYTFANDVFQNSLALTRVNKMLFNCLSSVGTTDLFTITDTFFETCVNWWENNMVYSATKDAANEIAVDRRIFSTIDDEGNETYSKVIEVLRQLCVSFGARVYQSNGRFVFEQYSERAAASRIVSTYDRAGAYIATASKSDDVVIDQTVGEARLAGNQFDFLPAIKRCEIEFEQKFVGSRVAQLLFTFTRTTAQPIGFISEDSSAVLEIVCPMMHFNINRTPNTIIAVPSYAIAPIFAMTIKIEDVNNPGTFYYFQRTFNGFSATSPYSTPQWTTTASDYQFDIGNFKFSPYATAGVSSPVTIQTDQLPVSGELTFQLKQPTLRRVSNGAIYAQPPLYVGMIAGSSIKYDFLANINYISNGQLSPESIVYKASNNATGIDSNLVLELGKTSIADGPLQTGNLAVWSGSIWGGSDLWRKGNSGGYKKLLQLLVTEALALHAKPIRRYNGSFYSSHDISRRYTFDTFDWLFIGGSLNANNENVDGEFFAIARDVTNIVDVNSGLFVGDLAPMSVNKVSGPNSFGGVFNDGSIAGMLVDSDTFSVGPFSQPSAGTARITGTTTVDGDAFFTQDVDVTGDLVVDGTIVIDGLGDVATESWVTSQGYLTTAVTSVALTAPAAFTVTGSPITTSGTIAIAAAGTSSQYVRGDGQLATFPSLTGFVPYTGATANVDLGTHTLLANDLVINHPSGSGVAASITKNGAGAAVSINKDGSGEALTVVKGSGSGNAASITGGVTLISELHLTSPLVDSYIANSTNWNAAYNDKINSAAVTGTTTKTLTLTQQDGGTITASWTDYDTAPVTSVFGRTGVVVAVGGDYNTSQVTENTNLYFTDARARAAISLTTTGTSGAATYNNTTGVLNVPQYQSVLTNPVTGTGTTNYVSKFTGTSTVGDSQIFDNGTNVGIGTATPSSILEIAGASPVFTINRTSGTSSIINFNSSGSNFASIISNPSNGENRFSIGPAAAWGGFHTFYTDTSERMRITAAGNVGIGTTSPAYPLDIVGFGNSSSGFRATNGTVDNRISWSSGNVGFLGTISNHPIALNTNATERVRITEAGNVGIGTTSPAGKLDVRAGSGGKIILGSYDANFNVTIEGGDQLNFYNGASATTGYINYNGPGNILISRNLYVEGNSSGGSSGSVRITSTGNVGIGTTAPSSMLTLNGTTPYIRLERSGVPTWELRQNFPSTEYGFQIVNVTAGTIPFFVGNSGNVGIGTTSPTYKFNVVSTAVAGKQNLAAIDRTAQNFVTFTNPQYSTDASMGLLLRVFPQSDARQGAGIIASGGSNNATTDLDLFVTTSPDGLGGTSYSAIKINGFNGNVGIGTTSPAQPLVVSNGGAAGFEWVPSTGRWYRYNRSTSAYAGIYTEASEHTWSIGASEAMRINASGNVGIGTTSPSDTLDLYQAANTTAIRLTSAGVGSKIYRLTSQLIGVSNAGFGIQNATDGRYELAIDGSGNVGIGTTSPSQKLHVNGNITLTNNADKILFGSGGASPSWSAPQIARMSSTLTMSDYSGVQFGGYDGTSYGPRMTVLGTGNVGIGTTSPSAKLHVIGNVTVSATLLTANVKLTGTLTDSLNQVGTSGQVLSSTGTGTEWITGGGGGGGSTIAVEDEGVSIGSSFGTLDFQGNNIQATASGSTAIITAFNNAGTGSGFGNDLATPYVVPATWMDAVEINGNIVFGSAPDKSDFDSKLIAMVTFGVSNVSSYDDFNGFFFRLYNFTQGFEITNTEHRWSSYMSKTDTTTVFTFHIPIESTEVAGGDEIRIQAQQTTLFTPEIYFCAITLLEGTY